ncbi:helix-turn-helix domain-containing protein [Paenibacillus sp. VCA1]|uniref:helix-turn-helix domain-containing protein n=1 Tax=Paenibacillus sp. VCA1 TaxID=3039148 RepID=UPI0028722119|nr:helix-turn-helix domain-containing protein [Paenibacillus sp. VCA1]MDR9855482.1 helix-turn-helix domain-containing protein [Paenibacillus sp. VCA1]
MFKQLRKYNRSVIVTWLVSYITVLTVPILISFAMYSISFNQVKAETNRANDLLLEQMEMSIDSKLKGLEQLSLEIALNRNISSFSSIDLPLSDAHYYDLFQISESLRTYKNANDYIDQIYVWYTNSDTVISTYDHLNPQGLFQKLRPQQNTTFKQWNSLFDQKYVNDYIPMKYWDDGTVSPVVVFARSLVFNMPGQPPAIVLFVMKDAKLIESAPRHPDASMFILDTESRYIAAPDHIGTLPQRLRYEELQGHRGMVYKEVQEHQAAISYITSKITGWKYVSVVPATLFNEKMEYMRKLTWISIGLCFLVGGVICVLFLRKNYMPIQVMLQSLSHKFGLRFDGGSSEYSFLQGAIHHYFTEKEDMRARFDKHRNTIRAHLLRRLLKGALEKDALLHESLAAHHIRFLSDRFVVVLISVDEYGKFEQYGSEDLSDKKQQMLHFILTNVLEDTLAGEGVVYATDMNDCFASIVNFQNDTSEEQEQEILQRITAQIREFMHEQMQVKLTIAVGGGHSQIYGITQSYQEALDALEYRIVLGSGQIIRYMDIHLKQVSEHHYYYPLSVEQQLIYVVKSGNYPKAEVLLEDIFRENFSGRPVSVPLAKCLMYNMASTMLNTLDEVSVTSKRTLDLHLLDVEQLLACEHVLQMKEQMKDKLKQVCEWIQTEKRDHHRYLIEDVRRYIEDQLHDPNLNISMIGDAFRMTPSYISRLYKDHTGETLLDTINRSRLAEAKGLLQEHKLTVNEVAGRVGYADVSTFVRTFKKFEGITPGAYQKAANGAAQ